MRIKDFDNAIIFINLVLSLSDSRANINLHVLSINSNYDDDWKEYEYRVENKFEFYKVKI